jgi:MFS superfamily sulfate permease-like transporter
MTIFKSIKDDLPASIVVFLVAVPLCLGIALASGAPLFSGLLSGIIGGIVVGYFSGSALGVSGPAAGLAVIVLNSIATLGSFSTFLMSVVLAGIIQLGLGFMKAGVIAYFFPSSVIFGMLSGIGIIIILKQIPHAFGYDKEPEGTEEFIQYSQETLFESLAHTFQSIHIGAFIVAAICLFILILWDTKRLKSLAVSKYIPGPLVAVIAGIGLKLAFDSTTFKIDTSHLVNLPLLSGPLDLINQLSFPDFSSLSNPNVYIAAIILALVASIETLLSLEATDNQDPLKRISPKNQELKAQGIGNIVAGLLGALPVTQVIVRSSANQQSGAKTKASAIIHGVLILLSIVLIPQLLNLIPLSVLAAILLVVGYKLAKPSLFKQMYAQGAKQFAPFMITILGIVFTDLLTGIALGMITSIALVITQHIQSGFVLKTSQVNGKNHTQMILSEHVSFLNKSAILNVFENIPNQTSLDIDAQNTRFIHPDILDAIRSFQNTSSSKQITINKIHLDENKYK